MDAATIEAIVRKVMRSESSLGLTTSWRTRLDVETGVSPEGFRYCWGTWSKEQQKLIPETRNTLTGFVAGVGTLDSEYKGKQTRKLLVNIDTPECSYSIKAGLFSTFSKSVLSSLASVPQAQSGDVVRIQVRPGKDEVDRQGNASMSKVVLPSVSLPSPGGFEWLRSLYPFPREEQEVLGLLAKAQEVFGAIEKRDNSSDSAQAQAAPATQPMSAAPAPAAPAMPAQPVAAQAAARVTPQETVMATMTEFMDKPRNAGEINDKCDSAVSWAVSQGVPANEAESLVSGYRQAEFPQPQQPQLADAF